jgi:hypothetical protein
LAFGFQGCGVTGMPGRSIIAPSTITLSPGLRPLVTIQLSPAVRLVWIGRGSILFSAPTTSTTGLPRSSRLTARCGTSIAFCCVPSTRWARTNMPGSNRPLGLGNSARMIWLPVVWSTVTSAKRSVPCGP